MIKSSKSEEQMIYLIKRGNCTFFTKSQFAQLAGAKMLIVMDFLLEDENLIKIEKSATDNQKLNIPTVMLDKRSSDILMNYLALNKSRTVTVSFDFALKADYDGLVHLEYWYQSSNNQSLDFLSGFGKASANLLKDQKFQLQLRHVTWRCYFCQIFRFLFNGKECISNGLYCANNPKTGPNKGRDIVLEEVRQICIFNISHSVFFSYISAFRKSCGDMSKPLEKCSHTVLRNILGEEGLKKLGECFNSSFSNGDPDKSENKLLAEDRAKYYERNVQVFPILYINGEEYKVTLNKTRVICSMPKDYSTQYAIHLVY